MIEIIGKSDTEEHRAALALQSQLDAYWGDRINHKDQKISILCSVQTPGQKVRDIDLLLLVRFQTPLPVSVPRWEELNLPREVIVKSLCVAIEVKSHTRDGLEITEAGSVRVRYGSHWHDASQQNRDQVFALKNFLEQSEFEVPWVAGVLWLDGCPQRDLPRGIHNVVGSSAKWCEFVVAVLAQQRSRFRNGFDYLIAEDPPVGTLTRIRHFFSKPIRPSTLDTRKVAAIAQAAVQSPLGESTDNKQVIYRGRGGTGKTIALLQRAFEWYRDLHERTLFLTYNVALAAEVERLLRILGIRDRAGESCVRVETMHKFLSRIVFRTGLLLEEGDDFLADQERLKGRLLDLLRDDEYLALIRDDSDLLAWDHVCVDEAQDCPEDERDILHRLFGMQRCVIADGIDQMVRAKEPCDWTKGNARQMSRTYSLQKSLRLQLNLVRFANAVAQELGMNTWQLGENLDLPGGHVIVTFDQDPLEGQLFDDISRKNQDMGNDPIDMLFCVPHQLVEKDRTDPIRCIPAAQLKERGLKVWDGTHEAGRRIPLVENEIHRFIQYESCRGLEGWITFLLNLDQFYEAKLKSFISGNSDLPHNEQERIARIMTNEWLMIPLTRCINTLVIQLESKNSFLARVMTSVAERCKDFVELRE